MKPSIKRVVLVATLIAIFAVATPHVHLAYSSETTAENKLSAFLSGVVGLDLTKYTLVPFSFHPGVEIPSALPESLSSPNFTLVDRFGGLVEEEILSYELEYEETKMDTMSIFCDGHMEFLKIYSYPEDVYIYSESPPTNSLSQAKNIIQRYQTFASQNYEKDTSYLVRMKNILTSVDALTPMEFTEGNITFQISTDGNNTRIQWIYTEGGISMERKRVSIKFRDNTFVSFRDTWGLYSVSGLSKISSEEAAQIALDAAQNCELSIGHENSEVEIVKVPDLSNAPFDISLTMVPYRNLDYNIPSRIERDPLMLYPYWQVHFYFNESIVDNVGVQVGVWGDTSEIIYCSGFGYYGISGLQPEEQKETNTLTPSTLAVVACLIAVPIISISAITLRRKNRNK